MFKYQLLRLFAAACCPVLLAACTEERSGLFGGANPFFEESPLFLHYPPFDQISNDHYGPAFERGMAEQLAEAERIASQDEGPTFENTIGALELTGALLDRTSRVFYAMSSAHTNDDIQALEQELAPQMAAHYDNILLNQDLFARVVALYENRNELGLEPEAMRLIEQYYQDFVRAGAALSESERERLREINARLALLTTQFSQNVLAEMNSLAIVVDDRETLIGMSESMITAAAERPPAGTWKAST